jgi:hypothetical protein
MTTLWGLLTALSFAMPLAGAFASPEVSHSGVGGYTKAVLVGLTLGGCCAWILRRFGHFVLRKASASPVPMKGLYWGGIYSAAVAWVVLALFIGMWASSFLVR